MHTHCTIIWDVYSEHEAVQVFPRHFHPPSTASCTFLLVVTSHTHTPRVFGADNVQVNIDADLSSSIAIN